MPLIHIDNPDDARLDDYRNLRDRVLRRRGGRFIVETRRLLQRMIDTGITPRSVLVERDRLDGIRDMVDERTDVFVVDRPTMTQLAGFAIHTGVLAIAERPPQRPLDALIEDAGDRLTLVVCSDLKETANLGAIVRTAAALGASGMVLGPRCCDPYYRRAIRVSMGAVFNLPIVHSDDLPGDLARLRDAHGVRCYATVLDEAATPLPMLRPPARAAVVLGHEVDGLDPDVRHACDEAVTIPMHGGTDSLNVSASAALFIHHMVQADRSGTA